MRNVRKNSHSLLQFSATQLPSNWAEDRHAFFNRSIYIRNECTILLSSSLLFCARVYLATSCSNIRLCPPWAVKPLQAVDTFQPNFYFPSFHKRYRAGGLNAFTNLCNFRRRRCQTLITLSCFRNVKASSERHVYNVTTIRKLSDSMSYWQYISVGCSPLRILLFLRTNLIRNGVV